jgi:hypothetical protein
MQRWEWKDIIDVLELNPDKGIDPKKNEISGCSTTGKATLAAGDTATGLHLPL